MTDRSTIRFFILLFAGTLLTGLALVSDDGSTPRSGEDNGPLADFRELYPFSEGRALARADGLFGYADSSGAWTIPPWFDYGEPFIDSVAVVYLNAKPYLINRSGLILFDHSYEAMERFDEDRFLVESRVGRVGVIDRHGRAIVSPVYESVLVPNDKSHVLTLVRPNASGPRFYSVVDRSGNSLVSEGEYISISRYIGGYAQAYRNDDTQAMLDGEGKECFPLPGPAWSFVDGVYPQWGFVVVERMIQPEALDLREFGLIDSTGALLIASPAKRKVVEFLRERVAEREWAGLDAWLNSEASVRYAEESRNGPRWNRTDGAEGRVNISYMRESDYRIDIEWRENVDRVLIGEVYTSGGERQEGKNFTLDIRNDSGSYELLVRNSTPRHLVLTHTPLPLNLTLQALDASGTWRDIESGRIDFFCLTSSVPVQLRPHSQIRYTTAAFEGAIPTRLRAALRYQEVGDPETMVRTLYSRDVSATINPGQFWRRPASAKGW